MHTQEEGERKEEEEEEGGGVVRNFHMTASTGGGGGGREGGRRRLIRTIKDGMARSYQTSISSSLSQLNGQTRRGGGRREGGGVGLIQVEIATLPNGEISIECADVPPETPMKS